MPIANVFNMAGEKIGEIELSEAIFGIEPNKNVCTTASRTILPTAVRAPRAHSPRVRFPTPPRSPGARRAPAAHAQAMQAPPCGTTAA